MGNLRKLVTLKPKLAKIRPKKKKKKSKTRKSQNHYFKQEISGNYYFKFTVKVKLAKMITLGNLRKLLL